MNIKNWVLLQQRSSTAATQGTAKCIYACCCVTVYLLFTYRYCPNFLNLMLDECMKLKAHGFMSQEVTLGEGWVLLNGDTIPAVSGEMSIHDTCISMLNGEEAIASSAVAGRGGSPAHLRQPPCTTLHLTWKMLSGGASAFTLFPAFVVSPVPEDNTYVKIMPAACTAQCLHPAAAFAPSLPQPLRCASRGENEA